ncbi:MAG: hypothetical protein R3248_06515 [Candidatus Promineifilaceae bacterium]|nr:hypothetical protein [Candidatus Promineifilaceae bacterium]
MKWTWLIAITFLILLPAACQPGTVGHFSSNRDRATFPPPPGQPIVLEVADLAAQPESYAGAYVRVSGRYQRPPVIVCEANARRSPARWMLREGELTIAAAGFENLIQPLWPSGLTVTVEGRWQWWRGPVGCGKGAPVQEVWYLAVTRIVSPSPITRVTLTPSSVAGGTTIEAPDATNTPAGGAEEGGTTPTATADSGQPTPSPTTAEATASATPTESAVGGTTPTTTPALTTTVDITATDTATPGTPSPTNTLRPGETPQPTGTGTSTLTPSPTNTLRPGETPQPTNTPSVTPSPTNTSQPGQPTATATATPTSAPLSIVDQGTLAFQDLQGRSMPNDTAHSWQIDVQAGDVLTVSVAAPIDRDLALEIQDSEGETVAASNEGPAGEIETIARLNLQEAGTYRVIVREGRQRASAYHIMVINQFNASLLFSGILAFGQTENDQLQEFTDNFWFFQGEGNTSVDITVAPTESNRDILFKVYGPGGELLTGSYGPEGWIDNGLNGEAEELLDFPLPSAGLYAVHVGESSFEPAGFTIRVTQ